ncbi:hypothetical protein PAXRUDRAFT_151533, partial [Paxillus rubicundulus Ve08.2h10]
AVFIYDHITLEGVHIICIITWHIDDGLAGSNNQKFLDWIKKQIGDHFGISDLVFVTKYLDIETKHDHTLQQLWMHQHEYILYLLE